MRLSLDKYLVMVKIGAAKRISSFCQDKDREQRNKSFATIKSKLPVKCQECPMKCVTSTKVT